MLLVALWFVAVLGYTIQTNCISNILSKRFATGSPEDSYSEAGGHTLTIYLTFIFFASWLLLVPIARIWESAVSSFSTKKVGGHNQLTFVEDTYPSSPRSALSADTHIRETQDGNILHNSNAGDDDANFSITNAMENAPYQNLQSFALERSNPSSTVAKVLYFVKLFVMALLIIVTAFSYHLALSMSPAFDVGLIQNTSIFEIVSLLYGVCGIAKRKNVMRNFLVMMSALIGVLVVSYTKATCDLLAGKLSINKETGELSDPFLFDRLKSALLCGLGALTMGPFAVLWYRWFQKPSNRSYTPNLSPFRSGGSHSTLTRSCTHLSLIGLFGMIILLPFLPKIPTSSETTSLLYSDSSFWFSIMGSVMCGTLPCVLALVKLNKIAPPEYITTCNLGAIIFLGIAEWIAGPTQTTIIRWEVIGYIILTLSCIILTFSYGRNKFHMTT